MTTLVPRRVVTGLDRNGRSCILFDGEDGFVTDNGATRVALLWQTDRSPVDNSGSVDSACDAYSFAFARGGTKFLIAEFAPGEGLVGPGMHATDTLDYCMLLNGRLTLQVETGEVDLVAGDVVVDRGVVHGWRNPGPEVVRMLVVNVDALPVPREAGSQDISAISVPTS